MSMFRETHARSVMKALSWRVMGTVATTVLVWIFTRRFSLALWVGGLEFVSKIAIFWVHERVWDRLRFGKEEIQPTVVWFTGLSGSGKSTVADWVAEELRRRRLRSRSSTATRFAISSRTRDSARPTRRPRQARRISGQQAGA